MAIKITGEKVKNREERKPPESILFRYIPGKSSTSSMQNFMSWRMEKLGTGKIENKMPSDEREVKTFHDKELNLYIEMAAIDDIIMHCSLMAEKGLEALGFLVGNLYRWKKKGYEVVHETVTGELESTAVSVKFRRDAFENLFDKLDEIEYDYVLIGWYHSHPGYTSFMSSIDMETQRRMFNREFHVSIVVDPVNLELKTFRVSNEKCIEVPYAVFGGK